MSGSLLPPPITVISRYLAPPRQQQLTAPHTYNAIRYQNAILYNPGSQSFPEPTNIQILPTTNHTNKNGPITHNAHTAHGKHAASVNVAAFDWPLLLSTLSAKIDRKMSHAAPFTHSHRLRL